MVFNIILPNWHLYDAFRYYNIDICACRYYRYIQFATVQCGTRLIAQPASDHGAGAQSWLLNIRSCDGAPGTSGVKFSAANLSIGSTTGCTITEKATTRAFSWLKAPTSAFTFKTLLRHYAKRALTPRSLNVKLGPRRNYHKGQAAIRHYANQTARPLWLLRHGPNFTLRDRGVNVRLA